MIKQFDYDLCEDIDRLVNILNEEDISLTHIENIIEDFLCQINSLC